MKKFVLQKKNFKIVFAYNNNSLWVEDGNFYSIKLTKSPLFSCVAKDLSTNELIEVDSQKNWQSVSVLAQSENFSFSFDGLNGYKHVAVKIEGCLDDSGVTWKTTVINQNPNVSVMEITHPTAIVGGDYFDLFSPCYAGLVIQDAGKKGYKIDRPYGNTMQFVCVYDKQGGVYFSAHDPKPAIKRLEIEAGNDVAKLRYVYLGENATLGANGFNLSGEYRWQALEGNWFDGCLIYKNFVTSKACWLPKVDQNGRVDTLQKFKDIPFWICDYIPNTKEQGDNKPMMLSSGSDLCSEDYWYKIPVELQKKLNVPVAYHVYNWHQSPFNVDYPHFLPAKDNFKVGLKYLKDNGIMVMPYINALSWETKDDYLGKYQTTFANTGFKGSVKTQSGDVKVVEYPQTHDGQTRVKLAYMCPTDEVWQNTINTITKTLEKDFDIDGVYFDQISASHGNPCYDKGHGHTVGGGVFWRQGYQRMMDTICQDRPQNSFYFSEDNTEEYLNMFDGFLTWRWGIANGVPAFPAIYAGYIQMIGRSCLGKKKEDLEFLKYSLAKSFVYGQQLGWLKADVIYNEKVMPFLKTLVQTRYKYTALFNNADMLRPPSVECERLPIVTSPALYFKEDVVMERVITGAWRCKNTKKVVLFAINVDEKESECTISFNANEYEIDQKSLAQNGFEIKDDRAYTVAKMPPLSIKVFEF